MTELAIKKRQNVYRLSNDIYDRKYDKQISEEEVRKALVGEKFKEIIEDDKNKLKPEAERMKIKQIKGLVDRYGSNVTLGELLTKIQGNKIHKCPKCNGYGFETVEYNGYPSGLPDSGFVYEPAYKEVECDLCNGEGYTEHEYKPRMVQDGWE